MNNLYQRSIEIILENQSESGGYIASPNFPTYHYCWFRDGSFIAYAMDLAEQHESARRFHQWVADRVNERRDLVRASILKVRAGEKLNEADILHTRYRLDGTDGEPGNWPNFQLDGFGTWLWALNEHQKQNPAIRLSQELLSAADLAADYLSELWILPCYDCWEEFPDNIHPHTIAAIYGGLMAYSELTGKSHPLVTDAIRDQLLVGAKPFGHFVKFSDSSAVDASLLALAVPYGVVAPDDPIMLKTVEQIEATILHGGGLHRYAKDSYYGGGAWILLTAWLGWYYAELSAARPDLEAGLKQKIRTCQTWIESRADMLFLPEQISENLNFPTYFSTWMDRWGEVASPLLWSHAKYIILQVRTLPRYLNPQDKNIQ
ncbi:MAG: glycoside hydrolase family 15 protein [Chloroflexi bacterium]|nr:glycoside hydrolase family 15 protein [Chloroflexota bacterium]